MLKLFAIAVAFTGLAATQQAPTLSIRVNGSDKEVMGSVIGGKDMVPLADLAKLIGAEVGFTKMTPTDRVATLTFTAPKPGFDESADTVIPVDADTSTWMTVANSESKLRVRDFVRDKSSWYMIGEIDVAKNAVMVQDRPPRDTMTLSFYVVLKDANGKTLGRRNMEVKNVSYEGGRYPISINLARSDSSNVLPASVGLRFNAAVEDPRG